MTMKEKIIMIVFGNHGISSREIERRTGISNSTFTHLKKRNRRIEKLSIETGEKLEKLYDQLYQEGKLDRNQEIIDSYLNNG
ncbi:hypothetical protein NQ016_04185 [Staphylococcus hyicus]|uniref:hypothetical protein n=1 Tax=Staphylococcus hyicus TaxID=1284 RepID=UPI00211B8259|nr:hypothetical protein [Staphylococcus hyicus]MCQ9290716.1 hypothetical protein [Staphylococcus hyicus]MCQ9305958.1 hypothetical protein [Staphylococcus hyicus]MCQ9308370.1 hypothetical protein [Staphylococcus hyicus]MCQ9310792.1 hypothetical protein [Staphylococcus hyicus]